MNVNYHRIKRKLEFNNVRRKMNAEEMKKTEGRVQGEESKLD